MWETHCNVMCNKAVVFKQAFSQFDAEGDGVVDVESMLMALKNSNGANLQGELSHVIRQLQACSLTPGKIEPFPVQGRYQGSV